MSLTKKQKEERRKEANHKYYITHKEKWMGKDGYLNNALGTGHLGSHFLGNEFDERKAIDTEIRRLHLGDYMRLCRK